MAKRCTFANITGPMGLNLGFTGIHVSRSKRCVRNHYRSAELSHEIQSESKMEPLGIIRGSNGTSDTSRQTRTPLVSTFNTSLLMGDLQGI